MTAPIVPCEEKREAGPIASLIFSDEWLEANFIKVEKTEKKRETDG